MKKLMFISTSLRHGSNSDMLADQFVEGAKDKSRLAGTLFCGGVNDAREIEGNAKLQEAYELGKNV